MAYEVYFYNTGEILLNNYGSIYSQGELPALVDIYYGVSSKTRVTENDIKNTFQTATGFIGSPLGRLYVFPTGYSYKYWCIPDLPNGATYTTATPTITTTSIPVGDIVIGCAGGEGNSTRTGDADTTNGTWSTAQQVGFGTTTSAQQVISQFKVQTTTASTQTYNPTFATSHDGAINWIQYTQTRLPQANTYFIFLD